MDQFKISREVATLTIAVFVFGYILGPLVWGPMSEHVGRWPCFLVSMLGFTAFNLGCALAPNTGGLIVFRFLAGSFAACPLTNAGAIIMDIWDIKTRGIALALFCTAPFAGPAIGPIVSGAIYVSHTSWYWVFYIATIFSGVVGILTVSFIKESYAPVILSRKARRLRKETGDNRYVAPIELVKLHPAEVLQQTFFKPLVLLITEPMILLSTLYTSYAYGLLYGLFASFPIIFEELHGLSVLSEGLAFLGYFLGVCIAAFIYIYAVNPHYMRLVTVQEEKTGKISPLPETRLVVCMWAGPLLVIGYFWLAWTSYPSVSYWAPLAAGVPIGTSILLLFIGLVAFTVEAYVPVAASALAANTIVRSAFGGAFPLFTNQMYRALNPRWASTVFAFLALIMVPMPFIFHKYGSKLRSKSKHASAF